MKVTRVYRATGTSSSGVEGFSPFKPLVAAVQMLWKFHLCVSIKISSTLASPVGAAVARNTNNLWLRKFLTTSAELLVTTSKVSSSRMRRAVLQFAAPLRLASPAEGAWAAPAQRCFATAEPVAEQSDAYNIRSPAENSVPDMNTAVLQAQLRELTGTRESLRMREVFSVLCRQHDYIQCMRNVNESPVEQLKKRLAN